MLQKNKKTQSLSTRVYSISSSRINVTNLPIRKLVQAQLKHESIFYLKNASGVPFIETQIPSCGISSTAPPPHMNFHYSIVWGGNQEIFTKIKSGLFSPEMKKDEHIMFLSLLKSSSSMSKTYPFFGELSVSSIEQDLSSPR